MLKHKTNNYAYYTYSLSEMHYDFIELYDGLNKESTIYYRVREPVPTIWRHFVPGSPQVESLKIKKELDFICLKDLFLDAKKE